MALDVGAMTPLLWGFEEREKLMEFYERVSGARMHANYFRPGGVSPATCRKALSKTSRTWAQTTSRKSWTISNVLLNDNRIFRQRTVDIGVVERRRGARSRLHRADAARFGRRLGPSKEPALRSL